MSDGNVLTASFTASFARSQSGEMTQFFRLRSVCVAAAAWFMQLKFTLFFLSIYWLTFADVCWWHGASRTRFPVTNVAWAVERMLIWKWRQCGCVGVWCCDRVARVDMGRMSVGGAPIAADSKNLFTREETRKFMIKCQEGGQTPDSGISHITCSNVGTEYVQI